MRKQKENRVQNIQPVLMQGRSGWLAGLRWLDEKGPGWGFGVTLGGHLPYPNGQKARQDGGVCPTSTSQTGYAALFSGRGILSPGRGQQLRHLSP
ncbi:hypothetical protein [Yersinia hibernica]|uniref:hypothetical protein n=1 Tax=Yersinia hibernica TaxID=2339259 RepID=UPI00138FCF3F|nr:hypothetical protein [Yersinia hibernica]